MKNSLISLLLLLLASPALFAATDWNELPKESRRLLATMEQQWPNLAENRRQQLMGLSKKWLSLPSEKRNTLWKRYQRWQSLPVAKQQLMQKNYQRFKTLPTKERQKLLQSHQRFHNMGSEQQHQMLHRFQQFQHRNKHHPAGGLDKTHINAMPPHHNNKQMENMNMDSMRQQMGNTPPPTTPLNPEIMNNNSMPSSPSTMGQMGRPNN